MFSVQALPEDDKVQRIVFAEGDEPSVLTSMSVECQSGRCADCPGVLYIEEAGDEPVFCVHACHRVK